MYHPPELCYFSINQDHTFGYMAEKAVIVRDTL